jgi:hypothetical protein
MEVSGQMQLWPEEKVLGTHWIGGWIVLRAGLEMVAKRKIFSPLPVIEISRRAWRYI